MSDVQDAIERAIPVTREEWSGAMHKAGPLATTEGYVVDVADWTTIAEAARQWADLMDDVREAVKGKTGNAILMTADEIGKHLGSTENE